MWNALKQQDGAALFDDLKNLGFETLELSRHLTPDQIEQLKPYLRENPPCSIHNFCPILPGTSQAEAEQDKILLSSLNTDERAEAVRRTVQTMELAVELEAPIVVLHLGEVDTYDRSYLMRDLYNYGEREFEAFDQKVTEATEWRKPLNEYRRLKGETSVLVAPHFQNPRQIIDAVHLEAVDAFNVAPSDWDFLDMARIAASADIPVWQASNVDLGIFDAFRLHASAAAPNCTFGSDLCGNFAHEHSLLKAPLVQDGYAIVPTGPGLGVELDEDAVARYAISAQHWPG